MTETWLYLQGVEAYIATITPAGLPFIPSPFRIERRWDHLYHKD